MNGDEATTGGAVVVVGSGGRVVDGTVVVTAVGVGAVLVTDVSGGGSGSLESVHPARIRIRISASVAWRMFLKRPGLAVGSSLSGRGVPLAQPSPATFPNGGKPGFECSFHEFSQPERSRKGDGFVSGDPSSGGGELKLNCTVSLPEPAQVPRHLLVGLVDRDPGNQRDR